MDYSRGCQSNIFSWCFESDTRQSYGLLGTGFGAVNDSDSRLARTFAVPSGAKSLVLDYNFVSEEPMQYVGSIYDDTLTFSIIVNGVEHEIKSETINTSQWHCIGCGKAMPKNSKTECHVGAAYDYFSGGKTSTYHTGWTTLSIDISEYSEFTIVVRIYDKGDSVYDSAVLLDNFQFTQNITAATFEQSIFFTIDEMNSLPNDATTLEELLAFAKAIDTTLYSIESFAILSDAITRAEITLTTDTVTQKNIDVMITALQFAIDQLE